MGLDMYLLGVKAEFHQHDYNIGMVKTMTEIGYWRKANAIHKWFGADDEFVGIISCQVAYVFARTKSNFQYVAICWF